MKTKKSVRFRADPKKVRVSIKRLGWEGWRVTVDLRVPDPRINKIVCIDRTPDLAIESAIQDASDLFARYHIDGMNVDMQWAYGHPFLEEEYPPTNWVDKLSKK